MTHPRDHWILGPRESEVFNEGLVGTLWIRNLSWWRIGECQISLNGDSGRRWILPRAGREIAVGGRMIEITNVGSAVLELGWLRQGMMPGD